MLGKELEDQDIVLTTYGTLQAELHESKEEAFSISKQGALLRYANITIQDYVFILTVFTSLQGKMASCCIG